MSKWVLALGLFLCVGVACAAAQDAAQDSNSDAAYSSGSHDSQAGLKPQTGIWIDWKKREIHALGKGLGREGTEGSQQYLLALRAAKADALRRLAGVVYGLRLESGMSLDVWGQEHLVERKKIEGLIKGAQEVGEPKRQEDGSVEIRLVMPMEPLEALLASQLPRQ
ncbi:hypothetical protein COW36_13945 [bacterium (Candidatus Blackallbacteria) CG17_big_fil_post_rev_8_21_14_2_50_48_46]|uniref:Uncharacterized protein n=1 Tax=bacterium (Candidatus Blackallbacteria) CG17_big_fil_post_rev_8_21_14_2_50_48_46 TaxID=2014261 RepID=A0A2M7G340_9BACT|nr:MAG: hypothetical protein COW64_23415 [bacterium (Candidatus Blackallbacteria) CG18_big_fil_WC_8_21_14_2_50_49_26]PIW16229.1 MAG: hypothetical protein COW36_13945 [bacterium (Candidatus Blackallbacteria) CG17_big_fil_post_rev_8_21_14_2_50_48_46]PIW49888.1 MAG: hypothetical protein COW20_04360 [bacterium (Candidatus Blackallbacteria) CG13_big_fil_rev_8_21_14_2_50_49_14]